MKLDKLSIEETELAIRNQLVPFRKELIEDFEELINTKFSKIGIDITHQGSINKFHELMNHIKKSYMADRENTSFFKRSVIGYIVPVLLGIISYGILSFLGQSL